MKIKVKPEGRKDIYIVTPQEIVEWLRAYDVEIIHNIKAGQINLGADWLKQNVIEQCESADRIAILTGTAYKNNMNHALAVISKEERLYLFDIVEITINDLEIQTKEPNNGNNN